MLELFVRAGGRTSVVEVPAAAPASALRKALAFQGVEGDYFLAAGGKPLRERGANGRAAPSLGDQIAAAGTRQVTATPRRRGGCFIFSLTILTIILLAFMMSICTCGTSLLIIPFLLPFLFILPCCCL